jgi:signal transduction histidine kinase
MEAASQIKTDETPAEKLRKVYESEYMDFVDLAAHELDAPLRKLTILTERLSTKFESVTQDKEIQPYLERMQHCISDMRNLIDELSVLGRVGSDSQQHSACNIETIINHVLQVLITPETKKPIVTIFALPILEGNKEQFTHLFQHLLGNAIKFSKMDTPAEINIQSSVLNADEKDYFKLQHEKKYHKIEITDKGIGFKNEDAEKIFRPFVRLHGKSKFAGSGIGLAICKKIMENHGGIIYAEGNEHEGSRFILILPENH